MRAELGRIRRGLCSVHGVENRRLLFGRGLCGYPRFALQMERRSVDQAFAHDCVGDRRAGIEGLRDFAGRQLRHVADDESPLEVTVGIEVPMRGSA